MQGSEDESAAGGGSGAEIRNMSRDFSGARLEKKTSELGTEAKRYRRAFSFRDIFMSMNRNLESNSVFSSNRPRSKNSIKANYSGTATSRARTLYGL